MSKKEALSLIDKHKKTIIDPARMLPWAYLRAIILSIPQQVWDELAHP